ncbi:Hpt domain-containing protein [Terasakiella sp. A23]|uniref:Hpt domain-containing protein n=1 Tax=Terasakiella sp. FCG-A23 TaxID=3080561 RepID=UPI002952CE33|nr:Hpt domain-containing protein [Terasakiella sp. A23]MDV7338391.1 Hpt domain-containing protein [Terasakiella sp. A23]
MSDILCEDTLNELVEQVGSELVETLLGDLADDAGGRVTRMQDLLAQGEMDELRKEAHTLKSSSGTLGLKVVSENAAIIERKLVTGEGPDVAPIVPTLPALLEEGLAAANAWIAGK